MTRVASLQTAGIIGSLPGPESYLSASDAAIAGVIASQPVRWPSQPTENPIWGLMRIVMAQQVSTSVACRLADRAKSAYPQLVTPSPAAIPDPASLRSLGLSQRRAECCADIVRRSDELLAKVAQGLTWEGALADFKGIGPWTIAVFRIMVLRDPDVLPLGDIGLERAIQTVYGGPRNVERLGETWRPFRSVACWYLWRTLGNEQLG
jgi:3-methyladenine DNA glycosylase/8-oxoguanine DNA glycosylase